MTDDRFPLVENDTITLYDGEKSQDYIIGDKVSLKGGSSIVYKARRIDSEGNEFSLRIKEFYPCGLGISRNPETYELIVNEEKREQFNKRLSSFEAGYRKQLRLYNDENNTNTMAVIQCILTGYGTKYIVMDFKSGQEYSGVADKTLSDCISVCLSIAKIMKKYHNAGMLYLDIKPDNIFVYPETNEMVMLFDFDSVTEKSALKKGRLILSGTRGWAAPELVEANYNMIDERTDFYEIGAVLFSRVMGRKPDSTDTRMYTKHWGYDFGKEIFKNVNPAIRIKLDTFFKKTLSMHVKRRYSSDDDLITALEELKKASDPNARFLYSSFSKSDKFFIGRDKEIEQLHADMQVANVVFLGGIGGIGKSELAKQYAMRYADSYDVVMWGMYSSNLISLFNDDKCVHINNYGRTYGEPDDEYYERKSSIFRELANNRVLLIIDNFDEINDQQLSDFVSLGCKMLFTTRLDMTGTGYVQYEIGALSNIEDVKKIFDEYCKVSADEEKKKEELIEYVNRHTVTIELLAKQSKASRKKPSLILEQLKQHRMDGSGKEKVRLNKDGKITAESTMDHLRAIFDISELTDGMKYVLTNLSMLPPVGIAAQTFVKWCDIDGYDDINSLENSGWLRCDPDTDYVSLHPVISNVVFDVMKPDSSEEKCGKLIEALNGWIDIEDCKDYNERKAKIETSKYTLGRLKVDRECDVEFYYIAARNLIQSGDYDESIEKSKYALERSIELFGEINAQVAWLYCNIGLIYRLRDKDHNRAVICYQSALEIRKKLYGDYHPEVADALHRIANCEKDGEKQLKQYFEVVDILQKSELNDKLHKRVLHIAYHNIGINYEVSGKYEKAIEYHLKSLELRREYYGETNFFVANSYVELGDVFKKMNDEKKALEYYKKALEIREHIFGEESSQVAATYKCISIVYRGMGEYELALDYHKKTEKISIQIFGEESSQIASLYNCLGTDYEYMGSYDDAMTYYKKAMAVYQKDIEHNQSHIALGYANYGDVHYRRNEYAEALENYLKAVDIYKDHPAHRPDKVREIEERIQQIKEKTLKNEGAKPNIIVI